MGNIRETTGQIEKTVVKVEKCGHSLSKEREPKLGGDLDATGHDLQNVKDVSCETINGETLESKLQAFFSGLEALVQKMAPKDHDHAEIKASIAKVATEFIKYQPKGEYADKKHVHPISDITGTVSLSKVEQGSQLASLLTRTLSEADHSHPDLSVRLGKIEDKINNLPKPETYDDSALLKRVEVLEMKLAAKKPAPAPVVNVAITPVTASKITLNASYLTVQGDPGEVTVTDAKGIEGSARVTPSGSKYVVRGMFEKAVQPLTFTFSSPPTVCSIGVSTESKES